MPSSAQIWTQQAVRTACQSPHLSVAAAVSATARMTDLQEALYASDAIWSSGRRFV